MIWQGGNSLEMEDGEPFLRSCWECNPAHSHLRSTNSAYVCFLCGRCFLFGRFLDDVVTNDMTAEAEMEAFMRLHGLEPGDSTTGVDYYWGAN